MHLRGAFQSTWLLRSEAWKRKTNGFLLNGMQSVSCVPQDCIVLIHIQSAHHSSPLGTLNNYAFKKKYCWNKLLRTGKPCLCHRSPCTPLTYMNHPQKLHLLWPN